MSTDEELNTIQVASYKKHTNSQQRKSQSHHASQAKLCRHQPSFGDHQEKNCIWMNQIQHHTGHQLLCKKHTNSQQRKSQSYHASLAKLSRHQQSFGDHQEKSCIWMNQIQHHTGHQFLCKKHTNSQQRKSQSYHAVSQAKLSRHQQSFGDHQEKSCIWMNQIQHHTGHQFLCKKHTNSQQRKSQSYHAVNQAKLCRHQQSFKGSQRKKLHLNESDSTPYRSPVSLQETYHQSTEEISELSCQSSQIIQTPGVLQRSPRKKAASEWIRSSTIKVTSFFARNIATVNRGNLRATMPVKPNYADTSSPLEITEKKAAYSTP